MGGGLFVAKLKLPGGVMDGATAYLSAGPRAMSALISPAVESAGHPTVVVAFHLFRLVFLIQTAPQFFQLLRFRLGPDTP